MAGSVNKVILIGRVGKDPDIRTMNSGDRVASFSLATSETWRDKSSGERKEKTEWHNVVIFNENLVKIVENYVKKGAAIYVEGALQTRKYEKEGSDRYVTEIVLKAFNGTLTLLGSKPDGDSGGGERREQSQQRQGGGGGGDGFSGGGGRKESYDLNDDIPFVRDAFHDENLHRVLRV